VRRCSYRPQGLVDSDSRLSLYGTLELGGVRAGLGMHQVMNHAGDRTPLCGMTNPALPTQHEARRHVGPSYESLRPHLPVILGEDVGEERRACQMVQEWHSVRSRERAVAVGELPDGTPVIIAVATATTRGHVPRDGV
jgi:hypothetical protein